MHDINLILGTMTIGEQIFGTDAKKFVDAFFEFGGVEIDTAYVYNNGECEKILGEVLESVPRDKYRIAGKANPRITGRLDREAFSLQLNESLSRLNIDYFDIFYLHFPENETPLEEILEVCNDSYVDGKAREVGLSNYSASRVKEVCKICEEHNWKMPTVYEGLYNPLSRKVEDELMDVLSDNGIRFYAYNPLAGGVLTDKYIGKNPDIKEGRFTNRPNYKDRYWKKSFFEAAESIRKVCKKYSIKTSDGTIRFLAYHSKLSAYKKDGMIIGASKVEQLISNLEAIKAGELPKEVVKTFNEAWEYTRKDAPDYYRFV